MSKRWFVVVDDRFVNNPSFLNMSDNVADEVQKSLSSETMLIAIRERKNRWPDLLPKLVRMFERHFTLDGKDSALQVIVLIHMECFNTTYNRNGESRGRLFHRFKPAETDLWTEIRTRNGVRHPGELEIYGLHFEEGTALYEALKSGLVQPECFEDLVIKVLNASDPATLFERISVVKHHIIGLFLPLDLTLQNWAEDRDPRLLAEVDSRLPVKLEGALSMLDGAEVIIEQGGIRADTSKVRDLLQACRVDARDAASFHAWVNNLDQALDEMRRAVVS